MKPKIEQLEFSVLCPGCNFRGVPERFKNVVRQGKATIAGERMTILDIGFGCPSCGAEFGFEMLKDRQ